MPVVPRLRRRYPDLCAGITTAATILFTWKISWTLACARFYTNKVGAVIILFGLHGSIVAAPCYDSMRTKLACCQSTNVPLPSRLGPTFSSHAPPNETHTSLCVQTSLKTNLIIVWTAEAWVAWRVLITETRATIDTKARPRTLT